MTHTSFVTPEMILRSVKIFHLIDLNLGSDFDWWRDRTWTLQIFRLERSMLLCHATTGTAGKNCRGASARAFRSAVYGSTRWAFWLAFSSTREYRRRRFNFSRICTSARQFLVAVFSNASKMHRYLTAIPYRRILSIAAVTGSSLFHLIQSALKLPQA